MAQQKFTGASLMPGTGVNSGAGEIFIAGNGSTGDFYTGAFND